MVDEKKGRLTVFLGVLEWKRNDAPGGAMCIISAIILPKDNVGAGTLSNLFNKWELSSPPDRMNS